jgi:protein phosphatase
MATKSKPLLVAASVTDVGRVRGHNEDAYLVDAEHGLFVVSDGMGGQQAGALASQVVVKVLPRLIRERIARLRRPTSERIQQALRDAIVELSRQLHQESTSQLGLKGMGATVVVALVRGRCLHIAHMGDSRAYLFRKGSLTQLTEDHSVVGILLRSEQITPEEAKTHPARSQLSRYVGIEGEVHPDARSMGLVKGDRLILCTDGLTGMVSDAEIAAVLKERSEPQEACRALVDAANKAGGTDNITVVVLN